MPTSMWGHASSCPGVFSCLFLILNLISPNIALAKTLVIGEVNWAGSEGSIADEWVELWNTGTEAQSLTGWTLVGASVEPIIFEETHLIPPQEAFLIANYAQTEKRSALSVQPAIVTTEISLANDKLHLTLLNVQGEVIDEAGGGKTPLAGGTQPPSSMLRQDVNKTGDLPEAWITSTSSLNLDASTLSHGTPGICDECRSGSGSATTSTWPEPLASTTTSIDTPLDQTTPSSTVENTTTTFSFVTSTMLTHDPVASSTLQESTSTPALPEPSFSSSTQVTSTATTVLTTSSTEPYDDSSTTTANLAATAPVSESPPVTPFCPWHITNIFPAPNDGPEWLEVSGCPQEHALLENWSIHDLAGHILTITPTTPLIDAGDGRLRIHLPGQHLRNTGDTIILRGSENGTYDLVTYPSLKNGEHYEKQAGGTWRIPERETPEETPTQNPTPVETVTTPSLIAKITSATNEQKAIADTHPIITKKSPTIVSIPYYEHKTPQLIVQKKPTANSPKLPKTPKVNVKKSSSPSTTQSTRVRLEGIVGTPPGLIDKQRFILLNTEGRGLMIHTNNKQPSPPLGTSIELTGTILHTDTSTYLSMKSDDRWQKRMVAFAQSTPQLIDLQTEDPEKNWSLVELTAKVEESKRTSATIIVDDMTMQVSIPRSLNYRAERLKKGDLIRIQGIIDTSLETPKIYPRNASEITILESAKIASPTLPTHADTLPPWAPMGAATTTIAGGYGWKRLQKWREQKRLQDQLADAIKELSSSS